MPESIASLAIRRGPERERGSRGAVRCSRMLASRRLRACSLAGHVEPRDSDDQQNPQRPYQPHANGLRKHDLSPMEPRVEADDTSRKEHAPAPRRLKPEWVERS